MQKSYEGAFVLLIKKVRQIYYILSSVAILDKNSNLNLPSQWSEVLRLTVLVNGSNTTFPYILVIHMLKA